MTFRFSSPGQKVHLTLQVGGGRVKAGFMKSKAAGLLSSR